MARGRCGLPGMPNTNFFQLMDNVCEADQEKEPFEKEMKVLKTDINVQRKQIEETKERVVHADKQLLTLNIAASGVKKKYDKIMYLLKEDLLEADEEYRLLNKKMASANELRQKFYSLDNECENVNPANSASSCVQKTSPRQSTNNPPGSMSKQTKKINSCCNQTSRTSNRKSTDDPSYTSYRKPSDVPSYTNNRKSTDDQSYGSYNNRSTDIPSDSGIPSNTPPDPCNKYPRPPCCPPPKPPPPPPNPCHPPFKRPPRKDCCDRPAVPFCCKYPAAPSYGIPPQNCSKHKNCSQQSLDSNLSYNDSLPSSLAVRKTSTSARNTNSSSLLNRGTRNSSMSNKESTSPQKTCCSEEGSFSQTRASNKDVSPQRKSGGSCCSNRDSSPQRKSGGSCCSNRDSSPQRKSGGSCCSGGNSSPQRSNMDSYDYGRQTTDRRMSSYGFSGSGSLDPCAPPTYCPGRSACACCKCEPPAPKCPPSQLVKMPPYSTFFAERLPVKPCITRDKDNESDNDIEEDTQEITDDTSPATFPPKCCMSVYEDYRKKINPPPPVKLPVFIDPCDPCAEVPREISPFEDVVNISHTCGTQTGAIDSITQEKCCSTYPFRKRIIP